MIVRDGGAIRAIGATRRVVRRCAAAAATAALASFACGAPQATIKIGVPAPLSGSYSQAGADILNGARLAAGEINKAGGVLGAPIEIVAEDDACDANRAALVAQQLVRAGVVAAAGGYCSGASLPELTVFHRARIPYVLDASTNPRLTDLGYPEVFRTIGRDDHEALFVADFITHALHAKRAAVVDDSTTYAKTLADDIVAGLNDEGVDVVFRGALTPGLDDYTAMLRGVIARTPDVIYYTGYFPEAGRLVRQARALGFGSTFMGGGAANDPMLMKIGGAATEGMIVTSEPLPEFMPTARQFIRNYEKAYSNAPGPYSVYEYDAVHVVARAIGEAKSTKPADIISALRHLARYRGATGDIAFNEKGDRNNMHYMAIIVRGGAFESYLQREGPGRWAQGK